MTNYVSYEFKRKPNTIWRQSFSLPLLHQSNTELEFILSFFNQNVKAQAGAENRDFNVLWGEKKLQTTKKAE